MRQRSHLRQLSFPGVEPSVGEISSEDYIMNPAWETILRQCFSDPSTQGQHIYVMSVTNVGHACHESYDALRVATSSSNLTLAIRELDRRICQRLAD